MKFLADIVANGVALWVAASLIDGIQFQGEGWSLLLTVALVAGILGIVNAIVRPLAQLLSLPLIILTLGLFLVIVNALMLSLTSWLSGVVGLDFHVADFWWDAVLGAVIVSIVSMVVGALLPERREIR